LWTSLSSKV